MKITAEELVKKYPAMHPRRIWFAIYNKNRNGLQKAVTGTGKKAVIDEDAFAKWLRTDWRGT